MCLILKHEGICLSQLVMTFYQLLFSANKKLLTQHNLGPVIKCMSATRVGQGLGLGLGLGVKVKVRARARHCHLLT